MLMIIGIIVMIKDRHKYKQNKDAYKLISELSERALARAQTRADKNGARNKQKTEMYNKNHIHSVYRTHTHTHTWLCVNEE